ncbi:hypothetical protein RT41_GL000424 [Lactococcus fujiensis JCM 16395]|uniref:Uncharacterized protein n=1 Tax=Lactococcus fujiensis JCM 16395 TaxID=1291764 RepID=A0A2A5RJ81_9LACT|nr:hypothetical protein RT41_GL000424 [Lactococcus fujiensis JCM 16395]
MTGMSRLTFFISGLPVFYLFSQRGLKMRLKLNVYPNPLTYFLQTKTQMNFSLANASLFTLK